MPPLHTTLECLPTHLATMRLYSGYGGVVDVYLQERDAIGTAEFIHFVYADITDPSQWPYANDCRFESVILNLSWKTPPIAARSRL